MNHSEEKLNPDVIVFNSQSYVAACYPDFSPWTQCLEAELEIRRLVHECGIGAKVAVVWRKEFSQTQACLSNPSLITEPSFPRTDVPITAKISVSSFVTLDKHPSLLWIPISETSGRSWTHSSFHQILRQGIESPFWPGNCPWEERTPYHPLKESHQHSKSCG